MRIGYSFWGFLGDYKEDAKGNVLSTPDGNAAYGGYLIDAMQRAGHDVLLMQEDRDWPAFQRHGRGDFGSFSTSRRFRAYLGSVPSHIGLPKLDVLFLEWRFPIPGRNTEADRGSPGYQRDLERQSELLGYYSTTGARIIVWDMDYKLTPDDERRLASIGVRTILETSVSPKQVIIPRARVEPPCRAEDLLLWPTANCDVGRKLVYVGSRYERDDVIDEWIRPVSDRFPGQVHFYGNWERTLEDCQSRWPGVSFHGRISMKDFGDAYSTAVAVPLLAKKEYLEHGFITPRIWEAIIFGSIPVGLGSHKGIEQYLPSDLIARTPSELGSVVSMLAACTTDERNKYRTMVAERIGFMDVSNFVRTIERETHGEG